MAYADANTGPNAPSLLVSAGVNALLIGAIFLAAPNIDDVTPTIITKIFPVTPDPLPNTDVKPRQKPVAKAEPRPYVAPKSRDETPPVGNDLIAPPSFPDITTGGGDVITFTKPYVPPLPKPVFVTARLHPGHAGALQPTYPPGMIREGREGVVTVRVLIGVDGRVREVAIVSAETPEFAAATERQALRKWRFLPATRDGAPVESWREMTVRFEIP